MNNSRIAVVMLGWLLGCLPVLGMEYGRAVERNPAAVCALLDRIGGKGTADRFEIVLDEGLGKDYEISVKDDKATANDADSLGKDEASDMGDLTEEVGKEIVEIFVITECEGKPCIKGSTLSALTAGMGWYLNHFANINLTWNQPHVDLATAELPIPLEEEIHTSDALYRYYLNYCTFSYSMSTWTWERWQDEIDWMALHGVNMPLQIVGLEEVWRRFLMEDYGYTLEEVNDYVAGPCYMAWFGMNNLQGVGGPNPEWWYGRQGDLGRKIADRMRELGMHPVLPGFCQLPSNFTEKTGISTVGQGDWFDSVRPHLADPTDGKFAECASKFYRRLQEVMGDAIYFSMDPFHEGGAAGLDAPTLYRHLYEAMDASNPGSKWVIQQWQWNKSQRTAPANVPVGRLIILDLFADGMPTWNDPTYGEHDVIYSTIFNFGGRTGYFGRAQAVVDGYRKAKDEAYTVKGIGAAPEAIGQTPVMYDLLFELPWTDDTPDSRQWFADYSRRRYGAENAMAEEAWELIRSSALDKQGSGQGPHEAWVCARPNLDGNMASAWGVNDLYYDPDRLAEAAYKLLNSGLVGENYSFDLTDITRQVLTDYSRKLMRAMREAHDAGDTDAFETRRDAFLQLILDLDELLNTNSEFILGSWTENARKIADEAEGTSDADRDWLELDNARQLITTWSLSDTDLRDYSYRQWGGMLKDFYYERWKRWFDEGMKDLDWFEWEWNWAHTNPGAYSSEPIGDSKEAAGRLLPKYMSPFVAGDDRGVHYVPRLVSTDVSGKFFDYATRGERYIPKLTIPGTEIGEISVDFNRDNLFGEGERLVSECMVGNEAGDYRCRLTLKDGTVFIYSLTIVAEK